MGRYAVVDAEGNVENVIVWDGVTEHPVKAGRRPVEVSPGEPAEPGGKHLSVGRWSRAPRED